MHAPTTALTSVGEPLGVLEPDARVQGIPEAVIQDIWALQELDSSDLQTVQDEAITILNVGKLNTDGGPDYSGAHVRIASPDAPGGVIDWSGDVEVHRTSSEWLLHRHHEDANYNKVVLHVVLIEDRHTGTLRRSDGTLLPEVVLYPRLKSSLRSLLHRFYTQKQKDFYCQSHWAAVPANVKEGWIAELGLQRLRMKAEMWAEEISGQSGDELVYQTVMRALGYAKNADAMTDLARRIPLAVLRSQASERDVEAVLFGVSGLLPELADMLQSDRHSVEYVVDLRDRFARFQQTSNVRPMSSVAWQYFRLRPANFPTRRIAQAAALLSPSTQESSGGLLSSGTTESLKEALESDNPRKTLRLLVQDANPSTFWTEHVRFEQHTAAGSARIGIGRADRILMDAILPVLLYEAEYRSDLRLTERVASVLSELPAASDEITRKFEAYGFKARGALGTQGIHQLYREWCTAGRCLSCAIGCNVLSGEDSVGVPSG